MSTGVANIDGEGTSLWLTLPPTPYTLHSTPYHPTPYTLHPTPYTLYPTPYVPVNVDGRREHRRRGGLGLAAAERGENNSAI